MFALSLHDAVAKLYSKPAAHRTFDATVEAAYGVGFGGDEEKIVAHLFKLYAEKTEGGR